MNGDKQTGGWRLNLALTAGIMATVMIALVMAQLDALQNRPPGHSRLVIANVQATAVADGSVIMLPYGGAGEPPVIVLEPNATINPDVNPRVDGADTASAPEFPVCGEVPAGWLLYTVRAEDTATLLASATQADVNAILAANCLTGDALTAGMQILLPSEPVAALQCGPPQTWVRYQVRAGDTIGSLAVSRGTTIADILNANCRDSVALTAGQMIFLPPGGPVAPPPIGQPPVVQPPAATATPVPNVTVTLPPNTPAPPPPPGNPTAVPTIAPPLPTAPPPFTPVPTRILPTATLPVGATATLPFVPTVAPTAVPPTATNPASTATSLPTRVPPTATLPPPTLPPPATNTPLPPPPTNTPLPPPTATLPPPPTATLPPPPTDTPVPPPTDTPEPPPTNTPEPAPTETPEPAPAETWYRSNVQPWYWR